MTTENFYSVLGVAPTAGQGDLRRQYRRLARALHPDRRTSPEQKQRAAVAMTRVTAAYSALHDPHRRAEHDEALLSQVPSAKDQHRQVMLHVSAALAEAVQAHRDELPGLEQGTINRILVGADEYLEQALQVVEPNVTILEGSLQVTAFLALAKAYSRTDPADEAYSVLIRTTALNCLRGSAWESRLVWPEPAAEIEEEAA